MKPLALQPIKQNPLFSVLIANYNYADYISDAIESVLRQTYQNFEIIICDDGSTDNSIEVIKRLAEKDSRILVITKKNSGQASALNKAYSNSNGEIISLLDADDIFLEEKLKKVSEAFRKNKNFGVCIHKILPVNSESKTIGNPIPKNLDSGWVGKKALSRGGGSNFPPASGLSFRREITDFIFPIPVEFNFNADGILAELSQYITKIIAIDETLSKFRLHDKNVSSSFLKYPTLEVLKRGEAKISIFEKIHKAFLSKYFGTEIANRFNFSDRNGFYENKLAISVLEGKQLINRSYYLDKIKNKYRYIVWYFITLLPNPFAIKILQFWWSQSKYKRFLKPLSKYFQV